MTEMRWQWRRQDPDYANWGNSNQWTVGGGLGSLAREATQNSNDARITSDGPADLVFSFIRLAGADLEEFKAAMGWRTLEAHIDAMGAAAEGSTTAGQLRRGLEAIRGQSDLVLLRIADYGCKGLTGQESASGDPKNFGNFAKLCRMDLFSGKDEAAGGSFGLGKAVYWRFSALQTALFNSTVLPGTGVDDRHVGRLFGVQQGVVHNLDGNYFQGRGYFGLPADDNPDFVKSTWGMTDLARRLRLERNDLRPGTSALIVGFADPDDDSNGSATIADLKRQADLLYRGVAEYFWPLITRGRLRVRIEVRDGSSVENTSFVNPAETFTELAQALETYDAGETTDELVSLGDIVVRDIPIKISSRTDPGAQHPEFVHEAKLVVTLSDATVDSLENQVCLLRRSEMVVETISAAYEGHKYHAFLLAGAAVSKDHPTPEDKRADDFLRFAEPPAHDQWIPRAGSKQASQVNLGAHYKKPYRQNLIDLKSAVEAALKGLFGPPPVDAEKPPSSVVKLLSFLRTDHGTGSGPGGAPTRRPSLKVLGANLVDGRWHFSLEVRAPDRPSGWSMTPVLQVGGFDGAPIGIPFEVVASTEGSVEAGKVVLPHVPNKRILKSTVTAVSAQVPGPADETAVSVVLRDVSVASSPAEVTE